MRAQGEHLTPGVKNTIEIIVDEKTPTSSEGNTSVPTPSQPSNQLPQFGYSSVPENVTLPDEMDYEMENENEMVDEAPQASPQGMHESDAFLETPIMSRVSTDVPMSSQ